jgi:hypothetical protein
MHLPLILDNCGIWSSGSMPDTSSCVGYSTYPANPTVIQTRDVHRCEECRVALLLCPLFTQVTFARPCVLLLVRLLHDGCNHRLSAVDLCSLASMHTVYFELVQAAAIATQRLQ